MKTLSLFSKVLLFVSLGLFILSCTDHEGPAAGTVQREILVSGLNGPTGLTFDPQGRLFVSEVGTGQNQSQISLVENNQAKPVIQGLPSMPDGPAFFIGITHLLFANDSLYFLHGALGTLFSVKTSQLNPNQPLSQANLTSQALRPFIDSLKLVTPLNSNAYNLTSDASGNIVIADAGTNAVIKRQKGTGKLQLLAHLPNVTPAQEAVPTGIVFDGTNFLVTTLSGGPFTKGSAVIYQVSPQGVVSIYQSNYTTLMDLTLSEGNKPVVIELVSDGIFNPSLPSGRIANTLGKTLIGDLRGPSAIERQGNSYYVTSVSQGLLERFTW